MSEKHFLTHAECIKAAVPVAAFIATRSHPSDRPPQIYGVPRGGVPAAYLVAAYCSGDMVDKPEHADFIIDDLVDSGRTRDRYKAAHPSVPFLTLFDKRIPPPGIRTDPATWMPHDSWLVFPWENNPNGTEDNSIVGTIRNRLMEDGTAFMANDNIEGIIKPGEFTVLMAEVEKRSQALLDALLINTEGDPNTKGTAARMAKMYCREVMAGRYLPMPKLTTFPNTKKLDELYTTGPISIRSLCSHHFCPIIGQAWVGILPGEKLLGLSKFNRIIDWLACRPQIQEELAVQIADLLEKELAPRGLAVVIKAQHTCMTWRGVREHPEAIMSTSIMRGRLRENPAARSEFLALIK